MGSGLDDTPPPNVRVLPSPVHPTTHNVVATEMIGFKMIVPTRHNWVNLSQLLAPSVTGLRKANFVGTANYMV